MVLVPESGPSQRPTAVRVSGDTVIMRGDGDTSFDCARCGAPILVGVVPDEVVGFLFRCGDCGVSLTITA
jgi:predicted RNA-binding Zn-ribbon protein involved in translation (DUF1610 family)